MVDKLHEYQGCLGRLHSLRDRCKARWQRHRESGAETTLTDTIKSYLRNDQQQTQQADYSHIYRSAEPTLQLSLRPRRGGFGSCSSCSGVPLVNK